MVQGTRIEVIGEDNWETEGGGGLVVPADNWLGGVEAFAASLGQRGFSAVGVSGVVGGYRSGPAGRSVKFCGGLQARLLNRTRHGGRSGLVDAEDELDASLDVLNGAWSTVKTNLAVVLLLSSAWLDRVGRVVPSEFRSLELGTRNP